MTYGLIARGFITFQKNLQNCISFDNFPRLIMMACFSSDLARSVDTQSSICCLRSWLQKLGEIFLQTDIAFLVVKRLAPKGVIYPLFRFAANIGHFFKLHSMGGSNRMKIKKMTSSRSFSLGIFHYL